MTDLPAILRLLCTPASGHHVLATLVDVAGSSYRRAGARMLVDDQGRRTGSISGGCLEEDVILRAARVRRTGMPEVVTYDTTTENDLVWGVGLGCHGVVRVLLEPVLPGSEWAIRVSENLLRRKPTPLAITWRSPESGKWGTYLASRLPDGVKAADCFAQTIQPAIALTIFGAGDDAQPLLRIAKELGWIVAVADPRAEFATPDRFPLADTCVVGPPDTLVQQSSPPAGSVAVVMTHRYIHDVPILRALLARPMAYVGLLGPRKRAQRILADLRKDGQDPPAEALTRFHAPVGLDLGGETPEEVALSIVAEIRAALSHRDARPLRERTKPIHS